jgi:UV DNA damage endonuclease
MLEYHPAAASKMDMMCLGFPVKILGQSGLKSHDTRRWQNHPHLTVSLAYLRDIFVYLKRQNIRMYRMASDLAPYVTHPEMPQFHTQVDECATELALVGEMAKSYALRLSFHLPPSNVLNSPDRAIVRKSAEQIMAQARILEIMGLGPEAVIVTHVGGLYGDKEAALERFLEGYQPLPDLVRRRLVLENDDGRFSVNDIARISQETGIPLVFDYLHLHNHNPEKMALMEALELCLQSWPHGIKPKIHFSSPRTAIRIIERKGSTTEQRSQQVRAPRPVQHADFIDPFQFISFIRAARSKNLPEFDIMLEAKAKDLALLHLRQNLARFAPEIVSQ